MGLIEDHARFMMGTVDYLGASDYLVNRSIVNLRYPWGWEDPRHTFMLPLRLSLFPRARVVCIERDGIDVAQLLGRGTGVR